LANRDFPSGLRPLRNQNGSAPMVESLPCVTTVLYEGALLFLSGGAVGKVQMYTSSVLITTGLGLQVIGVAAEPKAAGASKTTVLVYTDPQQLYEIQSDDATVDSNSDALGLNFAVVAPNAGNATTGRSISELDGNSAGVVASTSVCRILHVINRKKEIGDAYGANVKLVVKLNKKFLLRLNEADAG